MAGYGPRFFKRRIKKYQDHQIKLAQVFNRFFKPASVCDLGCGIGSYLLGFKQLGICVAGFEKYIENARSYVDPLVVYNISEVDVGSQIYHLMRYDLVMSIEVAEHLEVEQSEIFCHNLTDLSKKHILLTAAGPGQRGTGHINCRTKDYWIDLITANNFDHRCDLVSELSSKMIEVGDLGLSKNLMVFTKHGL